MLIFRRLLLQKRYDTVSQIISVLFTTCVACLRCDAAFVVLKDSDDIPVKHGALDEATIRQVLDFTRSKHKNKSIELRDNGMFKEVLACRIQLGENEVGTLVLLNKQLGGLYGKQEELQRYLSLFQQSTQQLVQRWEAYTASCTIPDWKSVLYLSQEMTDAWHSACYDVFCWARFADCVGGDFYDFYRADDKNVEFVIADVAGKGIEAGFPMGEMKDSLRILWSLNLNENEFAREANKMLYHSFEKKKFATLLHMKFDFNDYRYEYLRAGHSPILHFSSATGETGFLSDEGLGLGMVGEDRYEDMIHPYKKSFNKGDIFLLYTDGVIDAKGADGYGHFGYDRLQQLVRDNSKGSSEEIGRQLIYDLNELGCEGQAKDDQSFIVIKT